ncbi:MAG: chemotaxis protein CheA [Spirochaetales bacterium]|nr:chemotaxis protein CheA [Spirochaetales bacterium]
MNDAYRETFRDESRDLLERLEKAALDLGADPSDGGIVHDIFRILHTIKGTSAMFDFTEVSEFAHRLESLFSKIRDGKLSCAKQAAEAALASSDFLRASIAAALSGEKGDAVLKGKKESLLALLGELDTEGGAGSAASDAVSGAADAHAAGDLVTYRIRFRPPEDIFMKGVNPEAMLRELSELGACRIIALPDKIPELETLDPERCYFGWDVILSTSRGENAVRDVFIFVEDQSVITIDVIDVHDAGEAADTVPAKKLGEILLDRGDISREDLRRALQAPKRLGEALSEAGLVGRQEILSALAEQEYLKKLNTIKMADLKLTSIRVKAEKVDDLINLVGELVTLQERLKTTAGRIGAEEIGLILEENERVVEQLRNEAMSVRLLALDTIFSRYHRVVHDLAAELGKNVEFSVSGSETELDKSVIERLNDPLVHIIRNCIDHGIEPEAERTARGKRAAGRIGLRAFHEAAEINIEVTDDGRGLDRDGILRRARERGLIAENTTPPDDEIHSFVFLPGFSTARSVTEISGRGVGMDVVKRTIESLGGRVTLRSEPGRGTAVLLKIPLTLSIIEGLFVRIAGDLFVIPMTNVEECVELPAGAGEGAADGFGTGRILTVQGELLPYIRLREYFGITGDPPPFEKVVVVRSELRFGMAVDELVGNAQVVIKSIGGLLSGAEGILGATVTGDGTVSLILDVGRIAATVRRVTAARLNRRDRAYG